VLSCWYGDCLKQIDSTTVPPICMGTAMNPTDLFPHYADAGDPLRVL